MKKEILEWLREQEDELMRPVKLSGHPPTQYIQRKLQIIANLRALIEQRRPQVTREELKKAMSPDVPITILEELENLIGLLRSKGIEIADDKG